MQRPKTTVGGDGQIVERVEGTLDQMQDEMDAMTLQLAAATFRPALIGRSCRPLPLVTIDRRDAAALRTAWRAAQVLWTWGLARGEEPLTVDSVFV